MVNMDELVKHDKSCERIIIIWTKTHTTWYKEKKIGWGFGFLKALGLEGLGIYCEM